MFVNSVTVEVEIQNKVLFNRLITKKNLSQPNKKQAKSLLQVYFLQNF